MASQSLQHEYANHYHRPPRCSRYDCPCNGEAQIRYNINIAQMTVTREKLAKAIMIVGWIVVVAEGGLSEEISENPIPIMSISLNRRRENVLFIKELVEQ